MRISDWSSDVCSSDLPCDARHVPVETAKHASAAGIGCSLLRELCAHPDPDNDRRHGFSPLDDSPSFGRYPDVRASEAFGSRSPAALQRHHHWPKVGDRSNEANFETKMRSEEHTSELQSLMRNSYAVFCLKK